MPVDVNTPTDWTNGVKPLNVYVETRPNSGEFVLDPRIQVLAITRKADGISTADLEIFAGPIDSETYGTEDALTMARVLNGMPRPGTKFEKYLDPDQQMMIARDLPPAGDDETAVNRQVLFAGYPDVPSYDQGQSDGRISERFTVCLEDTWKRQNLTPECQIYGRWMRSAAAQIELMKKLQAHLLEGGVASGAIDDTIDDQPVLVHVEAYPAIFNPDGKPNRAREPMTLTVQMIDDNGEPVEEEIQFYPFTTERDPDAQPWTYMQVLIYLVVCHWMVVRQSGAQAAELFAHVQDGNILQLAQQGTSRDENILIGDAYTDERPIAPVSIEQALEFAVLDKASNLSLEKTTLGEALGLICEEAGLHYRIAHEAETTKGEDDDVATQTGRPVSKLHIWARGAGNVVQFKRETIDQSAGYTLASDVFDAANVAALSLSADYSDVYPNPLLLGDVERWEITTELVPGWKPETSWLDNIPAEQISEKLDAAKLHKDLDEEELVDDAWYQRFHKKGSLFQSNENRIAGKLFVLNEDARFLAVDQNGAKVFARDAAPWDETDYEPWLPTNCHIRRKVLQENGTYAESDITKDEWVLRGRPFKECFSADADLHTLGYVIEVTADNDISREDPDRQTKLDARTWKRLTGLQQQVIDTHAAVFLDCDDLTQVFPWKEDETVVDSQEDPLSLWAAIVEHRLGVRITAVIEGDQRVKPTLSAAKYQFLNPNGATKIFDVSERFKFNRRDLANSQYGPDGDKPAEYQTVETTGADDDEELKALQQAGETLLAICCSRAMPGQITVPWCSESYGLGDTVSEITGTGMIFWSYGDNNLAKARHPDIVAVKTTATSTTFFLEDMRYLERLDKGELRVVPANVTKAPKLKAVADV